MPCGEAEVALFRVNGDLFAMENVCPHAGASLHDGWMQDGVVVCPWHGWGFDARTGECVTQPGFDVPTFKVVVENGEVAVEVT